MRSKSDRMQALRSEQHPQHISQARRDGKAKRSHRPANNQPCGHRQPGQPTPLRKKPADFNDDRHRPEQANRSFAVAQLITIQREKHIHRHMREHMQRNAHKHPSDLRLP